MPLLLFQAGLSWLCQLLLSVSLVLATLTGLTGGYLSGNRGVVWQQKADFLDEQPSCFPAAARRPFYSNRLCVGSAGLRRV